MQSNSDSESILGRVSQQLAVIQKRDWELWMIVVGIGIMITVGFLAMAFPGAVMKQGNVHIQFDVSRELFLGLIALFVLFNTYVINRRVDLRRTRETLISSTLQSELVRLQSFTDPLTEVYNRRSFDEMAAKYIGRAKRLSKPLSFMIVDVDRFKEANSRFGHLTGDFLLTEIATLLKSAVRGSDSVVRFGGDEFAIILADSSLAGGEIVISRISWLVEDWNKSGQLPGFELTLSIGLAEWSEGKTLDQVLTDADQKMYLTKAIRKKAVG